MTNPRVDMSAVSRLIDFALHLEQTLETEAAQHWQAAKEQARLAIKEEQRLELARQWRRELEAHIPEAGNE